MNKFRLPLALMLLTGSLLSNAPLSAAKEKAQEQAAQKTTQKQQQWRTLSPENTLYLETETGRIIIELAANFSPHHVKHVKKLVRKGFYDGLDFYRVINNFVVQGGDMAGKSKLPLAKKTLTAEFEHPINSKANFTLVQNPDLLAEQTGFIDGFAIGRSLTENKQWLLTCPGVINLARSSDINSATTDFAIMIGQAPRHLDRNMSIFGRIIDGIEHLNHIKRGKVENGGAIENPQQRSKIIKMTIAADLPKAQQLNIQIEHTHTQSFKQMITDKRTRPHEFFHHKGNGAVDICYLNVKTKISERT